MSRSLRIVPEAEAELLAAATWYESKRRGLGVDFVAVIDAVFDEIARSPAS